VGLISPNPERRHNAALTIWLAAYTYSVMTLGERAKVDEKVYENLHGWLSGISKFEFQRLFPPALQASWRAYAMSDLNIPPAVEGEMWHLTKSWRLWGGFTTGPGRLYSAYRPSDATASKAKSHLEFKGINVEALDL
jgi:hypothetical protein